MPSGGSPLQMLHRQPQLRLVPPGGAPAGPASPAPRSPRDWDADAVYAAHAAYVANVAYRMLGRDSEVDDVVQEVFTVVVKKLHLLENPDAIRPWLASITVKCVHKLLRRRRVRRLWGGDVPPDYETIAAPATPPETRSLVGKVNRLLDDLAPHDRIAWVLRYIEGEALEDVARIVGCSLATAKRRISAAQVRLREVIGDE